MGHRNPAGHGHLRFTLSKMKRIQPYTEATFKRYLAAGVTIAMGTDTQLEPYMAQTPRNSRST